MQRSNTENFIEKSKNIFGDKYDYSKVNYINSRSPVILVCKKHGDFLIIPGPHLSYKRGCKKCVRWCFEDFINKAKEIHGDKYKYNNVIFENIKSKIDIICLVHGSFSQTAEKHIYRKQGCPKCNSGLKDIDYFINESIKTHGNYYNYSKSKYELMSKKILIICPKHGGFEQIPSAHVKGVGCLKCGQEKLRSDKLKFVNKCIERHGNAYDYTKVNYIKSTIKVQIICKKHGEFWQTPNSHLQGSGCPKCLGQISNKEICWLNTLNIPKKYRHKTIVIENKKYQVDAFDSKNNTIYEFYGDYWHGNPDIYDFRFINKHNKKTFFELYKKTKERELVFIRNGFDLISIWENEFDKIIKSTDVKPSKPSKIKRVDS